MGIKQRTIVDQVMDEIRNLIASGEYKAGDKFLTENELAEKFGVGRSSVREALKVYNYMGVLESKPALGSFISESSNIAEYMLSWSVILNQNDMCNVIDLRGAMELWGLILLMKSRDEDMQFFDNIVFDLHEIIRKMQTAVKNKDYEALNGCDYKFHYTVIKASRNKLVNSIYDLMKSFMYKEIEKAQSGYSDLEVLVNNHVRFLEAIEEGDTQRALDECIRHILHTKELILINSV